MWPFKKETPKEKVIVSQSENYLKCLKRVKDSPKITYWSGLRISTLDTDCGLSIMSTGSVYFKKAKVPLSLDEAEKLSDIAGEKRYLQAKAENEETLKEL